MNVPGLKPKDLIGAPWLLAFALRADGWYFRSDIIWARPNPMPETVTDRPTKSHSYVFLLAKQPRYYCDQEAVREPQLDSTLGNAAYTASKARSRHGSDRDDGDPMAKNGYGSITQPSGRNVRSRLDDPHPAFPDAHFATFPEALARRCILAGTSEHGCCPECGTPWQRQIERPAKRPQASPAENTGTAADPDDSSSGRRTGHEARTVHRLKRERSAGNRLSAASC